MMKKPRNKSNIEVVVNAMNFSRQGAMMQGFIMNALERYCQEVIQQDTQPENWPSFITWEAWRACAVELNETLNKHLGPDPKEI